MLLVSSRGGKGLVFPKVRQSQLLMCYILSSHEHTGVGRPLVGCTHCLRVMLHRADGRRMRMWSLLLQERQWKKQASEANSK